MEPDVITLLLTDFDGFIISAAIFSGSESLLTLLVPQWIITFYGLFFNGWFFSCGSFSLLWKISLQLSVYHLRVPTPRSPWSLNLPKWQWRCHISLHISLQVFLWRWIIGFVIFFLVSELALLPELVFLTRQPSLVSHNAQYYSRFQYNHSLIVLGIE